MRSHGDRHAPDRSGAPAARWRGQGTGSPPHLLDALTRTTGEPVPSTSAQHRAVLRCQSLLTAMLPLLVPDMAHSPRGRTSLRPYPAPSAIASHAVSTSAPLAVVAVSTVPGRRMLAVTPVPVSSAVRPRPWDLVLVSAPLWTPADSLGAALPWRGAHGGGQRG